MKLVISINLDNAAFEDNDDEVMRILTKYQDLLKWGASRTSGRSVGQLMDSNGNAVGTIKFTK